MKEEHNKSMIDFRNQSSKGSVGRTAGQLGLDMAMGVLVGGLFGAILGKHSLVAGAALSGIGYFRGNSDLPLIGLGMMANGITNAINTPSASNAEASDQDATSAIKQRLVQFKDTSLAKLYLDQIMDKMNDEPTEESAAQDAGDSPENLNGLKENIDILDRIEQDLVSQAMAIQSQSAALPSPETDPVFTPYQKDIDIEEFEDIEEM